MRTLKDRVLLLIEGICGKEETATMFEDENISLIKGSLFILRNKDHREGIRFSYGNLPFTDPNHIEKSISNAFKEPLSKIENDESKFLQAIVYGSAKHLQKNDDNDRYYLYNNNKNLLDSLSSFFKEEKAFILEYDYEEFNGIVSKNFYIKLNKVFNFPEYEFKATSLDLKDDVLFWQSLSEFFATYHASYIPAEELKTDWADVIQNLPPMITQKEYEDYKDVPEWFRLK